MLYLILGIVFIVLCAYPYDWAPEQIKTRRWKYCAGTHLGDVLSGRDVELRHDTIFLDGSPAALKVKCSQLFYADYAYLHIEDLKTGQKGRYIDFGPLPYIHSCIAK